MKNKLYQNDFPELPGVSLTGCLFMSLLDIVAETVQHELTRAKVKDIYNLCNERGLLGTYKDKKQLGAFVWDHGSVLNMASIVLGFKEISWKYLARVYTDHEKKRGRKNYVSDEDYSTESTHTIYQILTSYGNGHFRRMNYDPWKGGTKDKRLKSVRYYQVRGL